ncbi:hypothetical protein H8B09_07285 [Paenibacillus sp. PR3]|uniref:Lipoprotein n=1 Tax=Paenibacillus terricola TaxID=2763503 RepID=A0ABR8MSD4_9BACL|nr:hypothetical protein [Paenibacillus terricola]MBD3918550.1 hypothetical protein [Paenibacillus terricola]
MKYAWKRSILAMTLTVTLAGCSVTSSHTEDEQVVGNDPVAAGQINTNNSGPNQAVNNNADWNGTSDSGTLEATGAVKPKPKQQEPKWDKAKPTLAGIALSLQKADVKKKLGTPTDNYSQDSESGPIDILEYKGLTIGFGSGDQGVLFIEAYAKDVVTGLNGLKVGDSEEAAVKALGKPDSQSSYLLTYKTANSLLKLDLDPDSHEILSIKLFIET